MMSFKLVCIECGNTHDNSQYRILCDKCRGLLDTRYDIAPTVAARVASGATGTARYLPLLPIRNSENLVTMNEGNTPLVRLSKISDELGLDSVWGKMEFWSKMVIFETIFFNISYGIIGYFFHVKFDILLILNSNISNLWHIY